MITEQSPVRRTIGSWLKRVLGVLLVVCLIGFFARNVLFGTPVETFSVIQSELRQTVVASGRVTWPQRVSVAAEMTGRVHSIPVKEGQQVQRGQLLIQLEDSSERASLAQASTAVALAEAKVRQQREVGLPTAQETLRQTQADVEQANQQLTRIRQLNSQNYISTTELETAQRNLTIATSKLAAAQLQVQSNQASGSDAQLAVTGLDQAQAALQLAKVKLAQTAILAPADGTLISRSIEPGEMVTSGKALMVLAAQGETLIEVQIDEKNLAKLALAQAALCSADAFPQQRFNAEVAYINPGVDATRGAVEVKLRVTQPPAYLRQDMTVSVDIETAQKSTALVMPIGALHEPNSDAPWVLVVRQQRAVRQAVTLGLRGDDKVEVLSGLVAGDAVIPVNLALIKANQRVRVTQP